MSMKSRSRGHQEALWVASSAVAKSPGHPFYEKLEKVLADEGFDAFVESECTSHYANEKGRPSIPPGVYFRSAGSRGAARTPYRCVASWESRPMNAPLTTVL